MSGIEETFDKIKDKVTGAVDAGTDAIEEKAKKVLGDDNIASKKISDVGQKIDDTVEDMLKKDK